MATVVRLFENAKGFFLMKQVFLQIVNKTRV